MEWRVTRQIGNLKVDECTGRLVGDTVAQMFLDGDDEVYVSKGFPTQRVSRKTNSYLDCAAAWDRYCKVVEQTLAEREGK